MISAIILKEEYEPYVNSDREWKMLELGNKVWYGWRASLNYLTSINKIDDYYIVMVSCKWDSCSLVDDQEFRILPADTQIVGVVGV